MTQLLSYIIGYKWRAEKPLKFPVSQTNELMRLPAMLVGEITYSFVVEIVPVDVGKEDVSFNIIDVVHTATESTNRKQQGGKQLLQIA